MEKFIPYEKLSKKEKRKIDQTRRQTWGELNPVTRKPENSKAYNRNKTRNWKRDDHEPVPGFLLCFFYRKPKLHIGFPLIFFTGRAVHLQIVVAAELVLPTVGEPLLPHPCVGILQ